MLQIEKLIEQLTLEEKASLCSGADFWSTKGVERLNIPSTLMTDGPHGLRKQPEEADHLGMMESIKAICFPTGVALASSFDRDLMKKTGQNIGKEAQAEKIHTVLGPAMNIKRSPLCGRNFEYYSEDPYLTGELATAFVDGVQSKGVAACVKHFAANNQEYRRMSSNSAVDMRTLREIYLPAFENAVKNSKPKTIMCSYNRINGVYACENEWLLNEVLREEWGFDGIVMTDWGAMNDRVKALCAGLNLEMPSSNGIRDAIIVEAVRNGTLEIEVLDKAVRELLQWIDWCIENAECQPYDKEEHHIEAKNAASESAVLLKNDGALPLNKQQKIAFIGQFAEAPRFQGGGSSHINAWKISSAVDAVKDFAEVVYCKGFDTKQNVRDDVLFEQAIETARNSQVVVIFAGLPDSFESEGFDRKNLELPTCQNELISAICKVQPNTVVVLHNGSPVTMPWKNEVNAILEMYLAGQASGAAAVELLFGKVNPSGKLAETFPQRLQDTPSYMNFPGTEQQVNYAEGVFVGYRWYDAREMDVLFPFGHGLSYTDFELSDLVLSSDAFTDESTITASVTIKNIGKLKGKEVVQLYVGFPSNSKQIHPLKQLKGFEKVELSPNEQKIVTFKLDKRSFAYFNCDANDWLLENGEYNIYVGNSSRSLPLHKPLTVKPTVKPPFIATDYTTIGDVMNYGSDDIKAALQSLKPAFMQADVSSSLGEGGNEMMKAMLEGLPLHCLMSFGIATESQINDIIDLINSKS